MLITDKHDILPWDRDDNQGWGIDVCLGDGDGPTVTIQTDDSSPAELAASLAKIDMGRSRGDAGEDRGLLDVDPAEPARPSGGEHC